MQTRRSEAEELGSFQPHRTEGRPGRVTPKRLKWVREHRNLGLGRPSPKAGLGDAVAVGATAPEMWGAPTWVRETPGHLLPTVMSLASDD